jgi:hypothetical protein
MIKADGLTPGYRQHALISINALVDIDIGLFTLIRDEYLDPSVFNLDYFKNSNILDFIKTTYFRHTDNPLYAISNIDHDTLDEYYMEFYKTQFEAIYDRSTYTDILHIIKLFLESKEIEVSVLYYKDYCRGKLENDQANGVLDPRVNLVDAKLLRGNQINDYNEIYLRSITEFDALPIKSLMGPKNFYISSFGPNFSELTGKIIRTEGLNTIMTSKLMHEISIFEMYDTNNLKKQGESDNGSE